MARCPSEDALRYIDGQEVPAAEEEAAIACLCRHRERMEDEQGYSATHCDCDPSVGLDTCLYCETVAIIERYYDVGPAPECEQ